MQNLIKALEQAQKLAIPSEDQTMTFSESVFRLNAKDTLARLLKKAERNG